MKKLLFFSALAILFCCQINLLQADVQVLFDEEDDFLILLCHLAKKSALRADSGIPL